MKRHEMSTIKAFLSSSTDTYRPSYGRTAKDFPRQCVLIGTTNESHYLTDTTGNRRFWPVACGEIDVQGLVSVRDQLWAEAVHLYLKGEPWWLTDGDESQAAVAEQSDRELPDAWESEIADWLDRENPHEPTPATVLSAISLEAGQRNAPSVNRVGAIMKRLGYRLVKRRSGGRHQYVRVYVHENQSEQYQSVRVLAA
jgi:putative DNA primase/helicase